VEEVGWEMLGSGVSFLLFSSLSLLGSGALSMRKCSCKELSRGAKVVFMGPRAFKIEKEYERGRKKKTMMMREAVRNLEVVQKASYIQELLWLVSYCTSLHVTSSNGDGTGFLSTNRPCLL
jgi:hypothetical protein